MKKFIVWLVFLSLPAIAIYAADQRIQYNERMVGANHPTLSDTLNRLTLVEHNSDGTHSFSIVQSRVTGSCTTTQSIRAINQNGSVICVDVGEATSGVLSFNSRTGDITPQASDYSSYFKGIAYTPSLSEIITALTYTPLDETGTAANSSQLEGHAASYFQIALGYTAEDVASKSTDSNLGTSDTLYPSQNAVKQYADNHFKDIAYAPSLAEIVSALTFTPLASDPTTTGCVYGKNSTGTYGCYTSISQQLETKSSPSATCDAGILYRVTSGTSGQQLYLCESANMLVLQGGATYIAGDNITIVDNVISATSGTGTYSGHVDEISTAQTYSTSTWDGTYKGLLRSALTHTLPIPAANTSYKFAITSSGTHSFNTADATTVIEVVSGQTVSRFAAGVGLTLTWAASEWPITEMWSAGSPTITVLTMATFAQGATYTTGGGGSCAYDFCETFEGVGYAEANWVEVIDTGGTIDEDYTTSPAPLAGSESLYLATSDYYLSTTTNTFTATDNVYFALMTQLTSTGTDNIEQIHILDANDNVIASIIRAASSTLVQVFNGTSSCYASAGAWDYNTLKYAWLEYEMGTGANGVTRLYLSDSTTKPSSAGFPSTEGCIVSDGTSTTQAAKIMFRTGYQNNWIVDNLDRNSSAIGDL